MYWSKGPRDIVQHPYAEDIINRSIDPRDEPRAFLYKSAIWCGVFKREMLVKSITPFRSSETPDVLIRTPRSPLRHMLQQRVLSFSTSRSSIIVADNKASSVRSRGKVYAVRKEFDEIDRWLARRDDEHTLAPFDIHLLLHVSTRIFRMLIVLLPEYRKEFIRSISLEFSNDDAGRIDWDALDSWRALNIRKIIDDPDHYLRLRESVHGESALSKAAFSLELGGVGALMGAP